MKKRIQKITLFSALFLSVGMSVFGQIPSYVPTNGLVGWWPFNGNANDESGNGNNGTVNGATLTTDRFGSANAAYYFSSSGCATRIDANVNTTSIQTGLTMSVWVMNVGNGCLGPRLLEFWPGSNGPGMAQWGTAYGSLNIYGIGSTTSTGFSCSAGIPMSPNNIWSHLVYTNNGIQGKFYKDGILITTVNSNGNPILASSAAFGRMNHPAYDAYNGNLDDIGIWNRALSDCEVARLYNSVVTTPPTVNLGSDTLNICGLNTTLDATNPAAASYSWNTGETTPSITVSSSGEYHITVTDTAGCSSSDSVYVSVIDPTITAGQSAFCFGDSTTLQISPSYNSSAGCETPQSPTLSSWTAIAPASDYFNLLKEGNTYYLRSNTDVLTSSSLNGPWTSLNFSSQIGNTCAGLMLGFDWSNQLFISTCHNDLYALSGTNWVPKGLGGFGCGGNFIEKLSNNRILVMKAGFLRDLYISDNNGTNWTNVTNVDNDYWDVVVADNGTIFSCGGSNTPSLTGIIKSSNNGQNWTQINSQLNASVTFVYALEKDCNGNLYAIGNDKIYKSQDNGNTWSFLNNVPALGASYFEVATNGDFYIFINNNGFYKSSDNGATWQLITDFPISLNNIIRYMKQIDDKIIVFTTQGVYAKSIQIQTNPISWSNGSTNQFSIQVQPTQTTTYSVTVSDGVGSCTDSITIAVNQPLNLLQGADTISICGTSPALDASNPAAASYSWNTGETTPNITVSSSGEYHVTVNDTAGCSSSDSVYVSVIDPTITAGQSTFCLGDSTTLSVNNLGGNSCGNLPAGFENGLVGRWSFCGNANDESGNGNNGVVTGATLSTDRFGNANSAYHFDGNDFIKVNSVYDYPNKTINCWFNASEIFQNGNNSYQILSIDAQTLNHGMTSAQLESGQISIFAGGENNPFFTPIDSNQWYMLTLVRNTTNVEYYLNGILLGSNNSGTITSTSNDNENLLIGVDRSEIVQFFKGNIDDIGIWNRALTQQEIDQLFYYGNLSTWWSDGTTNQTSIPVQPTQNTTYSVTVSDGVVSCTDSITIQVNNPQVNAGPDISVCEGDSTTLTATGASTYAWDNGVVNGQAFVPTVEGYYNVTGTDTLGCSNSVSIFLDLLQPTSSSISPVNCVNYTAPDGAVYTNSGQYTAVIPNYAGCDSTISINLTINNPSAGTEIKFACDTFTWIDGVTYTENNTSATYTLQNAAGCDSVVTLNLTINKLLNLNAGTDQVVCKGENVILAASGAETYNWNNGISDGVAFSPPLGTTTYTVTGTDGNGCSDTDEVVVTSDYCFEIPGALSPNGDNNNDSWEIKGLSNYPNAQVTVFDRWGQKVYEGSSTSTPWDGKCNGKDLPTADYYYVIELGNGDKYNGVVTLKR